MVREKEYWLSPIAGLDCYLAGRRLSFLSSGGGKSWANLLPPWEEEMKQEGEGICLAGPNRLLYDARRWILASYTVLASSYQLSLLPSPRVAKLSTVISFSRRVYRVRVAQFSIHDTSKCFFYLYKYKVKPRIVRRKIARQKMQLAQTYDNPFS